MYAIVLCLLVCADNVCSHLSCIGALIIILTHGLETFSQNMFVTIQKPTPYINATTRPAPVPYRSEYWDNVVRRGVSTSTCYCIIRFSMAFLHLFQTIRSHCQQSRLCTRAYWLLTSCLWSRPASPETVLGQSFPLLLPAESVSLKR